MKYRIEIKRNPKSETIKQIRNGLIAHNVENSTIAEGENLAIKAVSDDGKVVGGIIAWQWGGCLEIEYLWVSENVRGHKLGTELLKQLESLLSEHHHKIIITSTFSFQAPEFYLKSGFKITDEVTGYPNNVKKYFLKKVIHKLY
jgi:N-acetylglutamate synthase-like GNAT family acetyltransferase